MSSGIYISDKSELKITKENILKTLQGDKLLDVFKHTSLYDKLTGMDKDIPQFNEMMEWQGFVPSSTQEDIDFISYIPKRDENEASNTFYEFFDTVDGIPFEKGSFVEYEADGEFFRIVHKGNGEQSTISAELVWDREGVLAEKAEQVDEDILNCYTSFGSFENRERYLLHDANANVATLQAILNEEPDDDMAEFISMLIAELEPEEEETKIPSTLEDDEPSTPSSGPAM